MRKVLLITLALFYAGLNAQKQKPNIVFIISDQHKLTSTGAYGSKLSITPNIDALAKTGVLFNNCYTPAPVCAPARASLITGMYPYANGAIYHKAPVKMPNGKTKHLGSGYLRETGYHENITTLGEIFQKEGYITASPGKMHVHGELQKNVDEDHQQGNNLGFDEISLRYYTYFPGGHYQDEVGEDTYMRYRQFKKYGKKYKGGSMHLNDNYVPSLVEKDEDNFDMVVANKAVKFIHERSKDGKNFFIHVGFEKPHAPFTTTEKYLNMHKPSAYSLPETNDDWYKKGKYPWVPNWVHSGLPRNLQKAQNVMAAYNACITEMDDMVGRVVNALKEGGLYENTIIIYTTDHGEHLFEHGLRGKHNMYEAAVNVPFIVSYPKAFKQNAQNNSLVSFVDLMPTFANMIGSETPKTAQGISLVDVLKNGSELKERVVFSEFRGADYNLLPGIKNVPSRMMRKGDYKFIYTHGIIDQLYNIKKDPNELNNLIFDENHKSIYQDMLFQTLKGWFFQEYSPIETKLKNNKISWKKSDTFETYHIYFAKNESEEKAELIAENISKTSFKLKEKGTYWIVGKPNLKITSKFYGTAIPVATENYTKELPISMAIVY